VENHFESVVLKVKEKFETSTFWRKILSTSEINHQEYFLKTEYPLYLTKESPPILTKPFKSLIMKSFRRNIINNKNYPNPPEKGWLFPSNWFEDTNDLVRTCFVVKYLDGVEFLAEKFLEFAKGEGLNTNLDFEAKDEGYYAAHFYLFFHCEVPTLEFDPEKKTFQIEIQITTQLQEVISKLTHVFYEAKRAETKIPDKKWQWQYKSKEFSANYLGHILHYIEGMIMKIRAKQKDG